MFSLQHLSTREQNILATLTLDLLVTLYYFSELAGMETGLTEPSEQMGQLILKVIILSILASILLFGWIRWRSGEEEPRDERDYQIEAKANSIAYGVLFGAVALLIGHLIINAIDWHASVMPFLSFTPMLCAHALLVILLLSSTAKSVTQLYLYRRGI